MGGKHLMFQLKIKDAIIPSHLLRVIRIKNQQFAIDNYESL